MSETAVAPVGIRGTPDQPDLKPQRGWFILSLIAFLGWVGALLALYFKVTPQMQGL